jgi:hypothetical protein
LAKGDLKITFSQGTSTLNGIEFTSGSFVNHVGSYILIATDSIGNERKINFTVVDTSFPIVFGVIDGGVYDSKSGAKFINFDKGNATLNGEPFVSGSSIDATGHYSLVVTANNSTTVNFTYIKYGDVNGDAYINIIDLVAIKKHLLKIQILNAPYDFAGDIYSKGKVTISDLIAIKKSILNIKPII